LIRIFLLDRYRETIDNYLRMWARKLEKDMRPVAYESVFPFGCIDGGVFIFSDLERLRDDEYQRADALARRIESAGARVLNKPLGARRRYSLLRMLHEVGKNPFNVYRSNDLDQNVRFPVFIRRERAHNGAMSGLLKDREELNRALAQLKAELPVADDLLVVEYAHTAGSADGLFRKYSVLRIDRTLIARHIFFNRDWINKDADVVTDETLSEENQFVAECPHSEQVREIFELSGIDYGRIDYSVMDGRIVTWEINTNPRLLPSPGLCDPRRLHSQAVSARHIRAALLELTKAKSVKVPLAGCRRVVNGSRLSPARRLIYLASWVWKEIGASRVGRRVRQGIAESINLGSNQNP
jgi:hypothetical protein